MSLAAGFDPPRSAIEQCRELAGDIKLSHSIFALPWALLSTVLASSVSPSDSRLVVQLALIIACMVLARTVAMSANRLFDAALDASNPRTARRAIPAGRLSRSFTIATIAACGLGFVAVTSLFGLLFDNWLPLVFSLPVLAFIGAYPFLKRFTGLCHYYLGACLALAPVCAWIAIAGNVTLTPFIMAAAVLCWTAGFDIIYACQDYESDRSTGVFSVPARLGIARALWVARLTHMFCVGMLIWLGLHVPQFGVIYATAVVIATVLLMVEHTLVKPHDLSKVNLAFFTLNGIISLVIGALGIVDAYV